MAIHARILLIAVFLITLSIGSSNAAIIFQDADTAEQGEVNNQIQIASPNGLEGDFEILSCTSIDEGVLNMNTATPGWTEENEGKCDPETCIMNINSKFTQSLGGEINTCSWDQLSTTSVAGILRYSGVDPDTPIIALECAADQSPTAVAPSVITEANSVVVRIFTASLEIESLPDFDFGTYNATASFSVDTLAQAATAQPFEDAGPTGTFEATLNDVTEWRACTLALRMNANSITSKNVPTLSEWGLIATAAVLGITAFVAIRRKKVVA